MRLVTSSQRRSYTKVGFDGIAHTNRDYLSRWLPRKIQLATTVYRLQLCGHQIVHAQVSGPLSNLVGIVPGKNQQNIGGIALQFLSMLGMIPSLV